MYSQRFDVSWFDCMGEMRGERYYCEDWMSLPCEGSAHTHTPDAVAVTTEVSKRVFQGQNAPSLARSPHARSHVQIRRRGHREVNEIDDIALPPKLKCSGIFTCARAAAIAVAPALPPSLGLPSFRPSVPSLAANEASNVALRNAQKGVLPSPLARRSLTGWVGKETEEGTDIAGKSP